MKITNECYGCLGRLVHQAAELATEDPAVKFKAIEEGLKLLEREFSLDKTSIAVATPLHQTIRTLTSNPDPYFKMKETEVAMARKLLQEWDSNLLGNMRADIEFAVRGNCIDFFRDLDEIRRDVTQPVEFAIDDIHKLEAKLNESKNILYLADNTGEVFFDLYLVQRFIEYADVTYVVKESPVQNDITLSDMEYFGFMSQFPKVITTGTDTPGVIMEAASDEFKSAFAAADLVLAKGMGFWETLSELPEQGKIFHLLKAKCVPVANSIGVPLNGYVALMR